MQGRSLHSRQLSYFVVRWGKIVMKMYSDSLKKFDFFHEMMVLLSGVVFDSIQSPFERKAFELDRRRLHSQVVVLGCWRCLSLSLSLSRQPLSPGMPRFTASVLALSLPRAYLSRYLDTPTYNQKQINTHLNRPIRFLERRRPNLNLNN